MPQQSEIEARLRRHNRIAVVLIVLVVCVGVVLMDLPGFYRALKGNQPTVAQQDTTVALPTVVDGKDVETGLIAAEGMEVVKRNCTNCHSAKLITQNHLSRDRWEKTIRWMQKNQNLGDLGDNEKIILDYLEKNYGAVNTGRRKPLEKQVWYELK
jgi:hypothetical protein